MKRCALSSWFYLLFGLFDFTCFSFINYWLLHLVYVVFLMEFLVTDCYDVVSWKYAWPLGILLLEDCFLYQRFGLILVFLVPAIFFAKKLKLVLSLPASFLFPIFLMFFVLFDILFVNVFVMGHQVGFDVTMTKFFVNLGIGILAFWSLWGNCSLFLKRGKSGLHTGRMPYKLFL